MRAKRGLRVICAFIGLAALLGIASPPPAIAQARQVQPPLPGTARAALATRPAVDPAAQACGGLPRFSQATADEIMAGKLTISPFPATTIDPRRDGAINWNLNPFHHPTWQQTFQSGSWIEMLVSGYLSGASDADAYLVRAQAITKSWLTGVPIGSRDPQVLICLSEGFPGQAWIDDQIDASVNWLQAHWQGPWNHGLVQDLKLLRIACAYPTTAFGGDALTWRRTAMSQILSSFQRGPLGPAIDTQGVVNEQATGYEKFVYDLWQSGVPALKACGYQLPSGVLARIAKMPAFLAAATQPDGNLVQIGDTYVEQPPWGLPRPAQLVSVYAGGYVFGRSRYGPDGTFYSLRFGPGRQVHGHNDHMGVTYYARGRNLIVNAGHTGYEVSPYRSYLQSPQAASTFIAPGQKFRASAPTTLVADTIGSTSQYYQFTDYAFGGKRNRSVYVHDGPSFMLVLDRSSGAPAYQQLWHLDPALTVSRLTANSLVATAPAIAATASAPAVPATAMVIAQIQLPGQLIPPGSATVVKGQVAPSYQGWVSHQALQRTPAPVVIMTSKGTGTSLSTTMLTLIAATGPGTTVKAAVGRNMRLLTTAQAAGSWPVVITIGSTTVRVTVNLANGTIT